MSGRAAASAGTPAPVAEEGWSRTVATPFPTQMVGFTWQGAPTGAVEVRSGSGPWYEVEASPDEGPDAGSPEGRAGTAAGPVWLGSGVEDVEVRVAHGELADLSMTAIRSVEAPGSPFTIASAGAAPAAPGIISRQSWGAGGWASGTAGCGSGPSYAEPRYGVLHHTVNGNTYAASQSDDLLRGIYAFHTGTRGWCDVAYNFFVDRFGRVFEGRGGGVDKGVIGGHSAGFNTGSFGVALLGDHTVGGVTGAAQGALQSLISWKMGLHGIDALSHVSRTSGGSTKYPSGQVVSIPALLGHRDVSLTSCPGGYAYPLLGSLRARAARDVIRGVPDPLPGWQPEGSGPGLLALDAYGGLHPAGNQRSVAHGGHWPGWRIVRGAVSDRRDGGYVVDAYGGVHPYGSAGRVAITGYWPGFDIVRGIATAGVRKGWVLDAYGAIHPYGGAPRLRASSYWGGWDIARSVASTPDGRGGYVLDGFGGIHAFGSAPRARAGIYKSGWDIMRAVVLRADGRGGYTLDGFGGVWPFGGAPKLPISHYTNGSDTARGLVLTPSGDGGYVIDSDGRLWPIGNAPLVEQSLTWTGTGLTRGVAIDG
ncbi:MAG: N-acetylmuramoyl-L-alanine amidase [Actinomycetota bacterium]|nr:N-acetylmuramoyl-L-alanine amidase [Actinomycetota bacterium]